MKKIFYNQWFLLGSIIILALILRFINISAEPFWGDETLSLDLVRHYTGNIPGLINYLREIEVHPPLYYLLLAGWTKLFGYGEGAVRSLSLVFGLCTVWLSYYAGLIFFKKKEAGLLSALLVAVLPIQIEFSQEARPYMIFCFFALLAILGLWLYLERREWKYLSVFIFGSIAGIYLHYSFGFILVALFSWWAVDAVLSRRFSSKQAIACVGSIAVVFLAFYYWLTPFLYKMALGRFDLFGLPARHLDPKRAYSIFESSLDQLIWLNKENLLLKSEVISILLFKTAVIIMAGYLFYSHKTRINDFFVKRGRTFAFLSWIILIQVLAYIFAPQSLSYADITIKHIISASLAVAFLISGFFAYLPGKTRLVLIIIFMVSISTFSTNAIMNDEAWDSEFSIRRTAGHINENYIPGDMVFVYFACNRTDLNHYLSPDISANAIYPIFPLDLKEDFLATRDTLGFLENEAQSRIVGPLESEIDLKLSYYMDKAGPKRVWVSGDSRRIDLWFAEHGWKNTLEQKGDFLRLKLYVAE